MLHQVAAKASVNPKSSACAQVQREGEEQPRALHPVAALLLYLTILILTLQP